MALSPSAPATGAGIATLAPIAEVPAGDVDLYAPLGTIDAGEAGIRVSGNINIHAQQVLNAANIKAQGESVGVPVAASVNTGALSSASAAGSAVGAAQDSAQRAQNQARQNQPSIISVQILGFGDEPTAGAASSGAAAPRERQATYRRDGAVQVVGDGPLDATQLARLSADERKAFGPQQRPGRGNKRIAAPRRLAYLDGLTPQPQEIGHASIRTTGRQGRHRHPPVPASGWKRRNSMRARAPAWCWWRAARQLTGWPPPSRPQAAGRWPWPATCATRHWRATPSRRPWNASAGWTSPSTTRAPWARRVLHEIEPQEWRDVLQANLTSAYLGARHQIPPCWRAAAAR